MTILKAKCPCGQLWLSETYGSYDTLCNHDGKSCGAVQIENDTFVIKNSAECEEHKQKEAAKTKE